MHDDDASVVQFRDPERRKAVVLMAIVGSAGSALVDATVGRESTVALVSRMTPTSLSTVNKRLMKVALKKVSKSRAWCLVKILKTFLD